MVLSGQAFAGIAALRAAGQSRSADSRIEILLNEPIAKIAPEIYGHFAEHLGRCCNEGLWVGPDSRIPNQRGFRGDLVQALRELGIPILRWPGGCYADTYHWRNGVGPAESRPRTLGESCGLRVVEDNGFGISTSTVNHLPFRLGIFAESLYKKVNGRVVEDVQEASTNAINAARHGDGPTILWVELDRISSHTHSDDHRVYRSAQELERIKLNDPIDLYAKVLVRRGAMSETEVEELRREANVAAENAYLTVEKEPGPDPKSVGDQVFGPTSRAGQPVPFQLGDAGRTMVGALNLCLREALIRIPNTIVFGEDIADPKGGVFGFTKGLSTSFPGRVVNAPLAEATIIGTAVGLAATGYRPVFEVQFVDYLAPGFNQLLNQCATLRWRSNGDWHCPAIFYAPYGAYLPAGGIWHSQSNEGFWTHIPGLRVAVPSTPEDLIGLLWTALHEEDPTLLLIPKHIMRVRHELAAPRAVGYGQARIVRGGADVTIVTWGNCLEVATTAAGQLKGRCSIEIIDLISLVPCDWETIEASVEKTGRLVVINEDGRTGSFGQSVITEMVKSQQRFNRFLSPPLLVARDDVHVGFNPTLEYAVLPDAKKVEGAILEVLQ